MNRRTILKQMSALALGALGQAQGRQRAALITEGPGGPRSASAIAHSMCAEHVQQLGSESLLSNLMEVKD